LRWSVGWLKSALRWGSVGAHKEPNAEFNPIR
jgi:hypothetical protein